MCGGRAQSVSREVGEVDCFNSDNVIKCSINLMSSCLAMRKQSSVVCARVSQGLMHRYQSHDPSTTHPKRKPDRDEMGLGWVGFGLPLVGASITAI